MHVAARQVRRARFRRAFQPKAKESGFVGALDKLYVRIEVNHEQCPKEDDGMKMPSEIRRMLETNRRDLSSLQTCATLPVPNPVVAPVACDVQAPPARKEFGQPGAKALLHSD